MCTAILESAATAWALFAFRAGLHGLSPVMPALLLHTGHLWVPSVGPTLSPGWQPGLAAGITLTVRRAGLVAQTLARAVSPA